MNALERRQAILSALKSGRQPVSASTLAAQFSVSRQIIVGDIALLRAGGHRVFATPRGYLLEPEGNDMHGCECSFACCHTEADIRRELYLIVDLGGDILDVTVEHPVYGQICAPLRVSSRFDADQFVQKCAGSEPLSRLTGGVHLHRVHAANEAVLQRIRDALDAAGFLYHGEMT